MHAIIIHDVYTHFLCLAATDPPLGERAHVAIDDDEYREPARPMDFIEECVYFSTFEPIDLTPDSIMQRAGVPMFIWMWRYGRCRPRMVSIAKAERIRAERLSESRIRARKRRSEAAAAATGRPKVAFRLEWIEHWPGL